MNQKVEQSDDKWADALTLFMWLANYISVLVCIGSLNKCSQIGLLFFHVVLLWFSSFFFSPSWEKYWKFYTRAKTCKRKLVSCLSRVQKLTIKWFFEVLTQALSNWFFLPAVLKLLQMSSALNDIESMVFSWRKPLWDLLLGRVGDWFRSFNTILFLKP